MFQFWYHYLVRHVIKNDISAHFAFAYISLVKSYQVKILAVDLYKKNKNMSFEKRNNLFK